MMTTSTRILYVLECDHVMMGSPSRIVYGGFICGQCNSMKQVKGVHVFEWHARCAVCQFSRWTGTSEGLSRRVSDAHMRHSLHRTDVKYERNPAAMAELKRLRGGKLI
jgi:hypothetical protein